MKIAVDAMGGDFAPASVVEGVVDALKKLRGFNIVLVGNLNRLEPYIKKHKLDNRTRLELVHAETVIRMDEPSTTAIRGKKDSSVTVAAALVGKQEADAFVSIGHTGAAVAATVFKMGPLPGVERPCIATIIPAAQGRFVLVDSGATINGKAKNLAQFAIMGEVYSRLILGQKNPRVGLLNVGDEDIKGNDLTKETFKLLSDMPINFIGNIEGNGMFEEGVDVVVCDGFVGNAVLKTCEGLSKSVMRWLKVAFSRNAFRMAGGILAQKAFVELKAIGNYEEYGGAPLLGVNGVCVIGHGSSSPLAVRNAIRFAADLVKNNVNGEICARMREANIFHER